MMKTRFVRPFVIVLLAAATSGAQGDWATVTRSAEYAFARGQIQRAESEFKTALEIAQAFPPGDLRLETSLENLGRFYEHQSEFAKAQSQYLLLLAAQEYRLGDADPDLLDTLFAVARASQQIGDLPTVEKCLTQFDAIAGASGAADPDRWIQVLAMLARMEIIQENEEAALEWQRRAVGVLADDPNATAEERAIQLESLAQLELQAGEGNEAEELYERIAQLRAGEGDDAVSRTLAEGAEAAFGAGAFESAEKLAVRTLDSDPGPAEERAARTVLADVSWARVNRGTDDLDVLLAAAADDEELDLAKQRLQALLDQPDGSDVETLSHLVQVDALRGEPADAARWQRQMIDATNGGTLAMRLDLVTLLVAAGDTEQALAENASVLAALEAEYGPTDTRLVPVLGQRVNILIDAGRKRDARKVNRRLKKLTK
jgi:tetratricopeptide (TPR) repeat protein